MQTLPVLPLGRGRRNNHGRYILLPKENTSLANFWLALLRQAWVETPYFNHGTDVVADLLG